MQKEEPLVDKKNLPKVIEFYRAQGDYGFLSNFYPSPFSLNNKHYPTVEHFYQSRKFQHKPMEDIIIAADSPAEAFQLGRNANVPLREDWEEIKEAVMWEAINLKFQQNQKLERQLLETGEAKLVEHTNKDKFWGDGGNGKGKNRLGAMLMQLR